MIYNEKSVTELEKRIGYVFHNREYIHVALTHSSYANEKKINKNKDYERLEFLGDAVLELTVSDYLFRNRENMQEGDMTKLRASLVCEPTLALCAQEFELGKFIYLGKGEENTGGRERASIVSDVFEATIGAIYLDGGIECAKEFIYKYVISDMDNKIMFTDSKTILQEYAQERGIVLSYELVSESGPAHAKEYEVAVLLDGETKAIGHGRNKKTAEQLAAYDVLNSIKKQ